MHHLPRLLSTLSLALGLASPAVADLTAPQLWQSWNQTAGAMGQTITIGSEAFADSTLSIRDLAITMPVTDGTVSTTIPYLSLTENGDGSVAITLAPEYDLHLHMTPAGDEAVDMTMTVAAPGMVTTASGDPDAPAYTYDAPDLRVTLARLLIDGAPADFDLSFALSQLAGSFAPGTAPDMAFNSRFAAATMAIAMAGNDLDDPNATFGLTASFADIASTGSGTGKGLAAMADPARLLSSGARFDGTYSHGKGQVSATATNPNSGSFSWNSSSDAGRLAATIGDGVIDYSGTSQGLKMAVSGDAIPFPTLEAAIEDFGFGFRMPVTRTEAPVDFGLRLNLGGLTAGDFLWGMVDPDGALPRDPAHLLIDLAGKARLLLDLTNPEAAENMAVPGELQALTLKALRLSVAGAELTGKGGFTFDNSDLTTFDGLPAPEGSVDLQLVGAAALLDKLVRMGLLPRDQAQGALFMLGMFTTPSGQDSLSTRIEVTPDGAVSANGQRLR